MSPAAVRVDYVDMALAGEGPDLPQFVGRKAVQVGPHDVRWRARPPRRRSTPPRAGRPA